VFEGFCFKFERVLIYMAGRKALIVEAIFYEIIYFDNIFLPTRYLWL